MSTKLTLFHTKLEEYNIHLGLQNINTIFYNNVLTQIQKGFKLFTFDAVCRN